MAYLIFKYAVTAAVIVTASELAKRSDKLGALILALPLMTIITMAAARAREARKSSEQARAMLDLSLNLNALVSGFKV